MGYSIEYLRCQYVFWYVTVRYLTDEELEELLNNSDEDISDVEEEYTVP